MPPPRNDNETTTTAPTAGTAPDPESPLRNDNETTTRCPVCRTPFTPIRRQRYCSPACRQAAWRARHNPDPSNQPAVLVPPRTPRRDITVYECPTCDTRTLGQQWCQDCTRPCQRIGAGGTCPHCDEPVAISDLATTI